MNFTPNLYWGICAPSLFIEKKKRKKKSPKSKILCHQAAVEPSTMGRSKSNGFVLAATEETHNGHGPVKKTRPQTQEVTVDKIELGTLRRSITLVGAVAILIANIGGIGIFITPTMILRFSGSPGLSILIWLLGGIVQAAYAFCTVEIALMFNKAGGPYFYIYSSFGDMAGFVYMWGFVIFIVGPSWALGSYTASLYTLSVIFTDCQPSDFLVKLVALWLMGKLSFCAKIRNSHFLEVNELRKDNCI